MNTALWVFQGLLAVVMLATGGLKVVRTKAQLLTNPQLGWAADFSEPQIKLIGLAELLGAVGLVVPWVVRVAPAFTPVAAACLAFLMLGAARTHLVRKEPFVPQLVLAALCLLVAIGRSGLV